MRRLQTCVLNILIFLSIPTYSINSSYSIVTELSIKAGSRGLIFIVKTDKPIDDSFQNILKADKNQIKIKLFNVIYGLDQFSFSHLSENSPIENISISENELFICFDINFNHNVSSKIKTKYKNNKIHYLLSTNSYSQIDWTYSKSKKVSKQTPHSFSKQKKNSNSAKRITKSVNKRLINALPLNKIDIIQRGNVEKLIINLDNSVKVKTQNREDVLIAVFENVTNELPTDVFTLPENSVFRKVVVKENTYKGLNVVGLILYKSFLPSTPYFIHVEPGTFTIYAIKNGSKINDRLSIWSSDNNKTDQIAEKRIENKNIRNKKLQRNRKKSDAFVQSVEAIAQIPKIVEENQKNLKKMIAYRIYGRDPYLPLDNPDFIESDLPNIEQCKLVGILFDEGLKIALVENSTSGEAFALRENSEILNGRVLKIRKNNVIFLINGMGYSQRYVLNLQSNKK